MFSGRVVFLMLLKEHISFDLVVGGLHDTPSEGKLSISSRVVKYLSLSYHPDVHKFNVGLIVYIYLWNHDLTII
jgi:hypothetical protein